MSDVFEYPTEALQQPSFASVANMIGDPRLAAPLAQLKREVRTEVHDAAFIPKATEVKRDGIISTKRGAPRKPGRVTCALIVIEALALVKGKAPAAKSPTAQSACEKYWRCCGGKAGDPANWRQTIGTALADQSTWRRHIRDEIWQGTNSPAII